jgi:hypothetical protein
LDALYFILLFSIGVAAAVRESQLRADPDSGGAYSKGAFAACAVSFF